MKVSAIGHIIIIWILGNQLKPWNGCRVPFHVITICDLPVSFLQTKLTRKLAGKLTSDSCKSHVLLQVFPLRSLAVVPTAPHQPATVTYTPLPIWQQPYPAALCLCCFGTQPPATLCCTHAMPRQPSHTLAHLVAATPPLLCLQCASMITCTSSVFPHPAAAPLHLCQVYHLSTLYTSRVLYSHQTSVTIVMCPFSPYSIHLTSLPAFL